jgi:RNA recognition motif-containing protein
VHNRVRIRNLDSHVTSDGLRHLFAPYGTVVSAQVALDSHTGRSRGSGYVEMGSGEEALAAIVGMDGRLIEGRTLLVS